MQEISIVGSTGSIGTQAMDVVRAAPDQFKIVGLAAYQSVDTVVAQAKEFMPKVIAMVDENAAKEVANQIPAGIEVLVGEGALAELGSMGDVVLNAVVGFAGLPVTVAALSSGRRLALANKESLIAGAPVVQKARATVGAELVPVDSEHCAIHQCLGLNRHLSAELLRNKGLVAPHDVRKLILTASGGPFRGKKLDELALVTLDEALKHPTWSMGPKITIDSSTLMNKGLEVIEAHELFGVDYDDIEVVVHPQSIIHSMVEFCDGATIAQLSEPDMRLPIGYALAYPERLDAPFGALDWKSLRGLDFDEPDTTTFRCLALAFAAGREGGSAPAWLNAANEVAVAAFLAGRISWTSIAAIVEETLTAHEPTTLSVPNDVLEADARAREVAHDAVEGRERAA